MANTDPPDKVNDGQGPANRLVSSENAYTCKDEVCNGEQKQLEENKRNCEAYEPAQRRLSCQNDRADFVGHGAKRKPRVDDRHRRMNRNLLVWFVRHYQA